MAKKVNQIIPINLKRRQDKLIAFYGALHTSFVPYEIVKPFEAHDALDYPTAYDVREAASKEFSFWNKLDDEWIDADYLKRGSLCCLWSMQSVLSIIASESDSGWYVMCTDGVPFTMNWYRMHDRLNRLGDFDIFQLWHSEQDNYPSPPHYPTPHPNDDSVSMGLAGLGDGCFILTPTGASRILEWCEQEPWHNLEVLIYGKSFDEVQGCISTIKILRWVRPHINFEPFFGSVLSERGLLDKTERKDLK